MSVSAISTTRSAPSPFVRQVFEEVVRDRWIYLIAGVHAAIALGLAVALKDEGKLVFFAAFTIWARGVALVGLVYISIFELPQSIRANPQRPLALLRSRLPHLWNPRVPAGILLMLVLIFSNGAFTSVKNMLTDISSFQWDYRLAQLGAAIHGGRDSWRWLQPIVGHHVITRILQYAYTFGWLTALCAITTTVAMSRRLAFLRMRFFLTYLFCWIILGNLLAGMFMSAGPVYYGEVTGDRSRYAALLDYLSFSEALPQSSVALQHALWGLYKMGRADLGTGISAFPSLHVAMATLFALTCWKIDRRLGWAAFAFMAAIFIGSIHLAWHYAIDGYVSMMAVSAMWFTTAAVERHVAKTAAARRARLDAQTA